MVEEFSLGQRESEILVDSLEEVSSAKTKQCTGRISKKDLGWGERGRSGWKQELGMERGEV